MQTKVSIPPRSSEVENKMASSILYEKLAESVRKYPVLYDKRCADKLKKTLAWKDMAKAARFTTEDINSKFACVQTSPISFVACNTGNRRRLHAGNSKYAQWISNCLQYKLTFSVALNTYLEFLVRKPRKVDILRPKLKSSPPSWKKFLLSLNAPVCLAFLKFAFAFASHQWTRFYM